MIEDALTYTAQQNQAELTPDAKDRLMDIWLKLKPWPDFVEALPLFKENNIRLAFLSNFTEEMLRANARNGGFESDFMYLSTDKAQAFKPDPRAYQLAMTALDLPKQNIAFCAFAAWDAAGASLFGYPTVWVNRLGQQAENLDTKATATGKDIRTLVDFVIGS